MGAKPQAADAKEATASEPKMMEAAKMTKEEKEVAEEVEDPKPHQNTEPQARTDCRYAGCRLVLVYPIRRALKVRRDGVFEPPGYCIV